MVCGIRETVPTAGLATWRVAAPIETPFCLVCVSVSPDRYDLLFDRVVNVSVELGYLLFAMCGFGSAKLLFLDTKQSSLVIVRVPTSSVFLYRHNMPL